MPPKPPGLWLFKTDPETYSFEDLLRKKGGDVWDGVKNAVALKHLRAVSEGDRVLIYHTGDEKAIVGLARVTRSSYVDPKSDDPKLVVVDVVAERVVPRHVPLSDIKADPKYAEFDLVRIGRLSVMPVPEVLWKDLLKRAGI
jgi:predicted RNA-binding protein with PUA-like domain